MTVMTFPISYMDAMIPEIELGISYLFSMVVITEFKYPDDKACCKVTNTDNKNTNTCEIKEKKT